ncbi:nuclear transport factor 2 family protein [Nocardia sp. NPDC004068]|uniref:nuclear transport factor 2 family protein n=1 Tax=Nocardia sp. NPDC004068 TaxID=3364303 RepID=UPI00369BBEBC
MTETPRELVEKLLRELPARDADAFAALFAPDAVFEIPFTVPGPPERLAGREAVRDHLRRRWAGTSGIEVHGIDFQLHECADPELFVTEVDVDMTRPGAERARIRTSVNVIRIRDGAIVLFRDYMNTALLAGLDA